MLILGIDDHGLRTNFKNFNDKISSISNFIISIFNKAISDTITQNRPAMMKFCLWVKNPEGFFQQKYFVIGLTYIPSSKRHIGQD